VVRGAWCLVHDALMHDAGMVYDDFCLLLLMPPMLVITKASYYRSITDITEQEISITQCSQRSHAHALSKQVVKHVVDKPRRPRAE
jgi:hypothetical protein